MASLVDIGNSFRCLFLYFFVIPAYDCYHAVICDSSRPSGLHERFEYLIDSFSSLFYYFYYFGSEYSIYICDFRMMLLRTSVASSPHDFSCSGFSLYTDKWCYGLVSYHLIGSKCVISFGSPSNLMAFICLCPSYMSSIMAYVVAEAYW